MFRRKAGGGSVYWLGVRDHSGSFLDGGESYKLSIPVPVPASLFWSVTVYDAETPSEIQTKQDRATIRSLFDKATPKDNAVDLYFGPKEPTGKGRTMDRDDTD
jgi:hypothetical protein